MFFLDKLNLASRIFENVNKKNEEEIKKFIILTNPRSGSYYFVDVLNNDRALRCYGEVFKDDNIELPERILRKIGISDFDTAKRDNDPISFIEQVYTTIPGVTAVGFKIFFRHNNQAVDYLLNQSNIMKVMLLRNPIQSFISWQVAEKTGSWTSKIRTAKLKEKIYIDIEAFREYCFCVFSYVDYAKKTLLRTEQEYLIIDYNEIYNSSIGFEKVNRFLDVKLNTEKIKTSYAKQIKNNYNDLILNWKDFDKFLKKYKVNDKMSFLDFYDLMALNINEI